MNSTRQIIEEFHEFALRQIDHGGSEKSFDELLTMWRESRERENANGGIRKGLAAATAGKTRPVRQFLSEVDDRSP